MTRAARIESAARIEGIVQVGILLVMGGMAGAASFVHVHDLTVAHGQPSWIGWTNAVVVELMSIAAGLELRRRKRVGQPTGFVLTVLLAAAVVSLAAQVAQAERSAWGWLVAALPALGFLAVVKIVLSRTAVVPRPDRSASTAAEDGGPVGVADRSIDHEARRPNDIPEVASGPGPAPVPDRTAGERQEGGPNADTTEADQAVPRPRVNGSRVLGSADESASGEKPSGRSTATGTPTGRTGDRSVDAMARPDRTGPQVEDLLELGQAIAADLRKAKQKLTRDVLIDEVRRSGRSIGTDRASVLLRRIKVDMALAGSG